MYTYPCVIFICNIHNLVIIIFVYIRIFYLRF